MASSRSQFDLLLPAVDSVTADLAQDLLKSQGIPSTLLGPDFDVAELGSAVHRALRHQDLFVPRGARAAARGVLVEAWGEVSVRAHERGEGSGDSAMGGENA